MLDRASAHHHLDLPTQGHTHIVILLGAVRSDVIRVLLQQQGVGCIGLDSDILLRCALAEKRQTFHRYLHLLPVTSQTRTRNRHLSGLRVILELKWLIISFRFRIHASSSLT